MHRKPLTRYVTNQGREYHYAENYLLGQHFVDNAAQIRLRQVSEQMVTCLVPVDKKVSIGSWPRGMVYISPRNRNNNINASIFLAVPN